LTLVEALGIDAGDMVALVGGGGKTTAMFRLARELAEGGGLALTTSTTHIFAGQIALAPAHQRHHVAGVDTERLDQGQRRGHAERESPVSREHPLPRARSAPWPPPGSTERSPS